TLKQHKSAKLNPIEAGCSGPPSELFHYLEATSPFSGDKLKNKGMVENLMSKSEKEKLLHSKNFELNK
ncbi:hypothetical protein S245_015995, partial [Arachis hypogaea]